MARRSQSYNHKHFNIVSTGLIPNLLNLCFLNRLDSPITLYLWCFLLKGSSIPHLGCLIISRVASFNSPVGGRSFTPWKTLETRNDLQIEGCLLPPSLYGAVSTSSYVCFSWSNIILIYRRASMTSSRWWGSSGSAGSFRYPYCLK